MALILSAQSLTQIASGASSTITCASTTGSTVTAVANSPYVAIQTVGVNTFVITNTATFPMSALIVFTSNDAPAFSVTLPFVTYLANTGVQTGRSAMAAVATVRRRTNANFGLPVDADIVAMLNDGIETVARRLEPVLAQAAVVVSNPQTNFFLLPIDVERIRDANFSTGSPAAAGTIVYDLVQMEYSEFIQETASSPAGGVGGIPTIYTLIHDRSGLMLCQFYPYASTGQFNFHYWKRPLMFTVDANGNAMAASFTDLDSLWQEAIILYACSQTCENREDYGNADRYYKMFNDVVEQNMLEVKRRVRKRGTNTVRDVTVGDSVVPSWVR